jgi:molybdate transport system substrate-binding protein
MAAKQALQQAGLWESVKDKIVFGENVVQTLQFAQTGNVDVAFVARSISYRPGGRYVTVDPKWHQPINQALCVLHRSKNKVLASQFVAFLNGPSGRTVMKQYGFIVPGEP